VAVIVGGHGRRCLPSSLTRGRHRNTGARSRGIEARKGRYECGRYPNARSESVEPSSFHTRWTRAWVDGARRVVHRSAEADAAASMSEGQATPVPPNPQ
jgi:hypothetical protein